MRTHAIVARAGVSKQAVIAQEGTPEGSWLGLSGLEKRPKPGPPFILVALQGVRSGEGSF